MEEMTHRDTPMILRAVTQGWEIPENIASGLPILMDRIANDANESTRDRIAAAKVLVAMKDGTDKSRRVKRPRRQPQTTVVLMGDNLDDAKRELLSRIGERCNDASGT